MPMRDYHDIEVSIHRFLPARPPLPPIDEQAREAARQQPGRAIYYRDPSLPAGAPLTRRNIVGSRTVDANGEFTDYWINPDFMPQRATSGIEFTMGIELVIWRLAHGYIPFGPFIRELSESTFLVEIDPATDRPRTSTDAEGNRIVAVHTSEAKAPQNRDLQNIHGLTILERLPDPELILVINPDAAPRIQFWTHHLADLWRQEAELLHTLGATA